MELICVFFMIIRVIQINNDYNSFTHFNNSRYLSEYSSDIETLNNSTFHNTCIKDNIKSDKYLVNINDEKNKLNKEINNIKNYENNLYCNHNCEKFNHDTYVNKLFIKDEIYYNEPYFKENIIENVNYVLEDLEEFSPNNNPIYNWKLGIRCLNKYLDLSKRFEIKGVNYDEWNLTYLPLNSFCNKKERIHKIFETRISYNNVNKKSELKLFIKKIPIDIWLKQFEMMQMYNGEFIENGENFVMEAIVLSFLNEYYPNICPKFYRLLYEPHYYFNLKSISCFENINDINIFNNLLREHLKMNMIGYVVMISEFFGEDLENYIYNIRNKKTYKFKKNDKKKIMLECLKLINKLHQVGICHLDFSIDNILISKNGDMRLCDFSKSTPKYSYYLRHTKKMKNLCLFESCIPSVGKTRYIPPECWDLVKIYIKENVDYPFEYLKNMYDDEERKQYYFDVSCVDKYMLGILFIAIWNNGYLWYKSDPLQDKDYLKYSKSNMNFNKFWTTFFWPKELKIILRQLLDLECRKNLNLNDLISHPWFSKK
ncbi:serine/threonine protein kinase [Plasmodium falciparum NF54]|uniref:non-specific serine/threonine protein kinase n=2 Tax=Plasmodium falciparum TaxID=5833 RepID=C0H515_PLAF7|nr:serine/threonine protein kinase, FIKK family [Plasmodium falciparum 3D7]KAF4330555.1 serine/threonine protein kinase [Plasmodium falciparum NF54]PKC45068.1 serine/threonine protein kinase [Plasmodium falciparum NF54]CAX64192.2 serine/threonine protein kinase, FIKK family [Plasmodium falciparum 3D7]|eukprot:XP_024328960.1 serine/threonine protein kinase, FIKK family [Plasmodium falciparum 3D7]